jgi:anti-sigma factor RsiW
MAADPTGSMTCRELVELVTAYLDGALVPAERVRFEKHLVFCPGCVYYVAQMRQTIEELGQLREESIAPEAQRELLHAFRDWAAAG